MLVFSHLPSEGRNVLINKFADLDKLDFTTIQKHAEIPIPQGLDLQPDLFQLPPHDPFDLRHKNLPNHSTAISSDNNADNPANATNFNPKPENLADSNSTVADPTNLPEATIMDDTNISPNPQAPQVSSPNKKNITSSTSKPTSLTSEVFKSPDPQPDHKISPPHQYNTRANSKLKHTSESSDSSDNEDFSPKKQVSFKI